MFSRLASSVLYVVLGFLALTSVISASSPHSPSRSHSSASKRSSLAVSVPAACQDTCSFVVEVYTACLFPSLSSDGYICRDACTTKGFRKISNCSECLAAQTDRDSSSTLVQDLTKVRAACGLGSSLAAVIIKDTIPEPIHDSSLRMEARIVIPDSFATLTDDPATIITAPSFTLSSASTLSPSAESTTAATAVALHQAQQSSSSTTTSGALLTLPSSFRTLAFLYIAFAISTLVL